MRKITKRSFLGFSSESVRQVIRLLHSQHAEEKEKLEKELFDLKEQNMKIREEVKKAIKLKSMHSGEGEFR